MNVKNLQRADRWAGVPLCAALTLVRAVFEGRPRAGIVRPRSLLIVKLAEQGSTVLACQALKRAAEIVGRQNVHFIAFEDNRFILDVLEVVPKENVVTVSADGFIAFLRTMLGAIRRLRGLKLDAAIDLEFFSRGSAILSFLSGAKARVGFHSFFGAGPYRGNLMTHRLLYNPQLHASQVFLTLVESVLCDPSRLPTMDLPPPAEMSELPPFRVAPEERAEVEALLLRETGHAAPLFLLNPNASDLLPLRRWPTERYIELAQRILARFPEVFVIFTGSPAEAEATSQLVRRIGSPRCFSLAGKTTLRHLLVLYTLSEVLITNDSGPAHFASLTPIQVITLFGPETPKLFAARGPRNTALWAGIPCSPCVNAYNNRQSPCQDNRCMQVITVEWVFEEACRAYGQNRRSRPESSAR